MKRILLIIVAILSLASCGNRTTSSDEAVSADSLFRQQDSILVKAYEYSDTIRIKYAKGLRVEYKDDGIHVHISNPDPSSHTAPMELVVKEAKSRFV